MAVKSERKNRRIPYDASRRSSQDTIKGVQKPRGKGNVRKGTEPKKSTRRKKRKGFSLPSLPFSSQGFWRVMRWGFGLSLIAFLMFGAAIGMLKAYRFCTTSPYFAVTEVRVSGNSQVSTPEVLKVCGIAKGVNSIAVNIHEAEQELVRNPWIESVSIRRELPGTFIINIKERVPVFFARKDSDLYFLNVQGQLIAPVTSRNFRSLPMLEIGPGGEDHLHLLKEFTELFSRSKFPFKLSQISWVRLSTASGFEMYWEARRMHLAIGLDRWQENLTRIASVVSDIDKRKESAKVSSIRAADGQVWMTKEQEEKP
ncbi:MAG: FtsQ-type POTRA domain-containing protein [Mailhella sp.]|nr:FtsQ-type POTRA domain-containing protein [Mailhella sp.]